METAAIITVVVVAAGVVVFVSRRQHAETRRRISRVEDVAIEGRDASVDSKRASQTTAGELRALVDTAKRLKKSRDF